jgi:hypothetical protein
MLDHIHLEVILPMMEERRRRRNNEEKKTKNDAKDF